MEAQTRAGIELCGSSLRYAEVEQYGNRYRLLRLGSCEFDFNLEQEALQTLHPVRLEAFSEALRDVFADSSASTVRLALHPLSITTFFVPVPGDASPQERQAQLEWEASLLTGHEEKLNVSYSVIRDEVREDGTEITWCQAVAIKATAFDQLAQIVQSVLGVPLQCHTSWEGAVATVLRLAPPESVDRPLSLTVGWYPDHTEYVVGREGRIYFSHYAIAGTITDSLYFAINLLDRLNIVPAQIGSLYLYGEQIDAGHFSPFESAFRVLPLLMNPLHVVDVEPEALTASFSAEAYAPCVGITF